MAAAKKSAKSKSISEDGPLDSIQFLKDSPKTKKTLKREMVSEEEDFAKLIGQHQASAKKNKAEPNFEKNLEIIKRFRDLVDNQQHARKQSSQNLLNGLSEITAQVEVDYNAMKENAQKLEHLTVSFMKCIKQATASYKHKLEALKDIQVLYNKECVEMESDNKTQTEKVINELQNDIKKFKDKIVAETKRNSWEMLRQNVFHTMQNDF
ncbi:putative mitochondrial ribosomal protein [Operophtera brumata]|uniref:Putative mitochondrial ribosomal protein n=1 Tax=Operophtera brumata TaxID=104452 RepID=A0A0L7LH18_OPEBR|nr:putative mitochondrial ribosomal protein [Operophtera brumata]